MPAPELRPKGCHCRHPLLSVRASTAQTGEVRRSKTSLHRPAQMPVCAVRACRICDVFVDFLCMCASAHSTCMCLCVHCPLCACHTSGFFHQAIMPRCVRWSFKRASWKKKQKKNRLTSLNFHGCGCVLYCFQMSARLSHWHINYATGRWGGNIDTANGMLDRHFGVNSGHRTMWTGHIIHMEMLLHVTPWIKTRKKTNKKIWNQLSYSGIRCTSAATSSAFQASIY